MNNSEKKRKKIVRKGKKVDVRNPYASYGGITGPKNKNKKKNG